MKVTFTLAALDIVRRVQESRPAAYVFVFGSGCCEGTAPHLFADHHIGPLHEAVGQAADVVVFADEHVRRLYGDRALLIDVERDDTADGFSAEIELGYRFVLR